MIIVDFNPDQLLDEDKVFFEDWLKVAERARNKLNSSDRFNSKVWSVLKAWLLAKVFHNKCAYCENNIEAGFVGEAEHYRPKGGVQELVQGKWLNVKKKDGSGHPGYAWLAYDWQNLVPSCTKCNAIRGKGTKFPIRGDRVTSEVEAPDTATANRKERPYLLHPYRLDEDSQDPRNHIVFSPDGTAIPIDEIGEKTIAVLDLNREGLVKLRYSWVFHARSRFGLELGYVVGRAPVHGVNDAVDLIHRDLTMPSELFSAAVDDIISVVRAQICRKFDGPRST